MTPLEIYVLISPLLVVAVGLAAVGIAIWQDRRYERRKASGMKR
jgi:hypothetical protein